MLFDLDKARRHFDEDVRFEKTPEEIVKNNLAVINRSIKAVKEAELALERSLAQITMGIDVTLKASKNLSDERLKDRVEAIDESVKNLLKALPAVKHPISSIDMLSR